MKWDWIIIMVVLLALLAISGVYFFDNGIFWIFLVVVAAINTIFNGPNYSNKSYFLVNSILLAILVATIFYNYAKISFPVNWVFVVILIILVGFLVYEFITREEDPSMPWKDEW